MNLPIQQLSSANKVGNNSFAQTGLDRLADLYVYGPASAASAAAPVLDQLQNQLPQGLLNAGLGKDASTLVASLASGGAAAVIGATASGGSVAGGATAFNAVVNNRQIGAQERILARSLADQAKETGLKKPDGSAYTQADIENAMRNSGRGADPTIKGMLVDRQNPNAVTDKGAVFTAGSDGKTLVQVNQDGSNLNPNSINLRLAEHIVQQTGGSSSPYGWLDGQLGKAQPVASNPNAGLNSFTPASNGCASAECAGGVAGVRNVVRTINDVPNDVRNNVADGAAVVIRGSDITAAASTMAAAVPGPHQPGAVTTTVVATGVGFVANVVEQVARPDVGKGVHDFFLSNAQRQIDNKLPLVAPITNEVRALWVSSGSAKPFEAWVNESWGGVVKQLESSK